MPLLEGDEDPLGVEDLCTHRLPLTEAPHGYEIFKNKEATDNAGNQPA
jgi:threonine dehydrogenase-like Zn-dependent dehydrogenase